MNARNRIFILLGVLLVVAACWYFATTPRSGDLQLIGTVDANEVVVSSRLTGHIQTLTVNEGDAVQPGQLLATIESDDLAAATAAASASASSSQFKMQQASETERQTAGGTSSQLAVATAQVKAAQAALQQAQAQYEHQKADTSRTVQLAAQGVMSQQSADEQATALKAAQAAVEAARQNLSAAQAAQKVAQANTLQTAAAAAAVAASRSDVAGAQALVNQAQVNLGYTRITAPIAGKVNVLAARVGEVMAPGTPIVTITDLTQTWVYAPLPETQADAVQVGDTLRVVMPSGAEIKGRVIAKSAEGDFATQRDVSRRKRDIVTVRLKLLIDNPDFRFVPGMLAEVYIPKAKLVKQ